MAMLDHFGRGRGYPGAATLCLTQRLDALYTGLERLTNCGEAWCPCTKVRFDSLGEVSMRLYTTR